MTSAFYGQVVRSVSNYPSIPCGTVQVRSNDTPLPLCGNGDGQAELKCTMSTLRLQEIAGLSPRDQDQAANG